MPGSFTSTLLLVFGIAIGAMILTRAWSTVQTLRRFQHEQRQQPARRVADIEAARAYHDVLVASGEDAGLDERTWRDLDMDDVFCALDYTESEPGRQYLYRMLRTPVSAPDSLAQLDAAVRQLSAPGALTEKWRKALRRLTDARASRLVNLFYEDLPPRPRVWPLFPVLTVASAACLALVAIWPKAAVVWIGICLINIFLQVGYKFGLRRFAPAVHELPGFLRVAGALSTPVVPELEARQRTLGQGAAALASLARAARWLRFEPGQALDVLAVIYEYVNMLFLFDLNAFVFSVNAIRGSQARLREMYRALGYVDAVQALASWRERSGQWCTPEFLPPGKQLSVGDIVHPLLEHPRANSLAIRDRSVLVSGSNMSGKTTFIRTLGVNAILAQSVATVCASSYRAPMLSVRASIGRADSLIEGKSYYLAEAESIKALIARKADERQHLFLLDETFRGTNTTERVAAAYAVLRYLDHGLDLVLVATHDLEVLDLLGGLYEAYHFREQVTPDGLTFDYRIQPGRSSTRNAIALLRFMHFPDEVVDDATQHLDWQQRLFRKR